MFCSACGHRIQDGAHFCDNCGASLQAPGGVMREAPARNPRNAPAPAPRAGGRAPKPQDPYKEQIAQLKLEIRQMKLYLKQINANLSNTRAGYNETAAFVPRGLFREGYKWLEDFHLWGPQKQKQQLQQQIIQLEQELLGLQQAQAQWKAQQGQ
jgi:hypothetical protein